MSLVDCTEYSLQLAGWHAVCLGAFIGEGRRERAVTRRHPAGSNGRGGLPFSIWRGGHPVRPSAGRAPAFGLASFASAGLFALTMFV